MRAECDIRRLRPSYVHGLARRFRQTIILSNGRRPEINSLFAAPTNPSSQACCENFRGLVKLGSTSEGAPIKEGSLRGENLNATYASSVKDEVKSESCVFSVSKQMFFYLPCSTVQVLTQVILSY